MKRHSAESPNGRVSCSTRYILEHALSEQPNKAAGVKYFKHNADGTITEKTVRYAMPNVVFFEGESGGTYTRHFTPNCKWQFIRSTFIMRRYIQNYSAHHEAKRVGLPHQLFINTTYSDLQDALAIVERAEKSQPVPIHLFHCRAVNRLLTLLLTQVTHLSIANLNTPENTEQFLQLPFLHAVECVELHAPQLAMASPECFSQMLAALPPIRKLHIGGVDLTALTSLATPGTTCSIRIECCTLCSQPDLLATLSPYVKTVELVHVDMSTLDIDQIIAVLLKLPPLSAMEGQRPRRIVPGRRG